MNFMIMAVLTIFIVASALIMYSCITGAVTVDDNLMPATQVEETPKKQKPKAITRSMIFLDFSRSRSIA